MAGTAATTIGAPRQSSTSEARMRSASFTALVASTIAICLVSVLGACATLDPPEFGPFVGTRPDANTITEDQIRSSKSVNVYDVIAHILPRFLSSRAELGSSTERDVYLDGVRIDRKSVV